MYRLLFVLFIVCLFQNCQRPAPAPTSESATQAPAHTDLPADFVDFYQHFHRDSAYQMAHISWPLQGDRSEQVDSTHYQPKQRTWTPENWTMMRLNFNPNDYVVESQMVGDVMVIERIRARSVSFGIERRFAKQPNGEWEMIYYSDMQERGK